MSHFQNELRARQGGGAERARASGRLFVFLPYDQLTDRIGPLAGRAPEETGIVLVECPAKVGRRQYHKQKLALVLANLRHFALEQAARGVAVRHVVSDGDYAAALSPLAGELGPLTVMEPAERELREDLAPLVRCGAISVVPHEGWLTTRQDFMAGTGESPPWRMDRFYRHARRRTGVLIEDGRPEGGKWSFDRENRKPWPGAPEPPAPPRFPRDPIKEEVGRLVNERFADHPGRLDLDSLPATAEDARTLWRRAREECLAHFGPYEDAMTIRSSGLFHTRIAALLNLHRLLPAEVVRDAAGSDAPVASREGFVRQVLGWREFVRHVHRETDGFRSLDPDGAPTHLGARGKLPPAYWGTPSGLSCLDRVVGEVWAEGYSHHITRLMVLGNLATLLDVSPRELTDWFWVAFTDAYDWVVEPNVLGMATYGAGDLMTTKPYVSGAPYIDRMSDYCGDCAFDPKKNCPVTRLYWAFLARHEETLAENPRMRPVMSSLRRRARGKRAEDREIFEQTRRLLLAGRRLDGGKDGEEP